MWFHINILKIIKNHCLIVGDGGGNGVVGGDGGFGGIGEETLDPLCNSDILESVGVFVVIAPPIVAPDKPPFKSVFFEKRPP